MEDGSMPNSKSSDEVFSLTAVHEQVVPLRFNKGKSDAVTCKVSVSSVGQERQSVTHFAIDVEMVDMQDDASPAAAPSKTHSIEVMG
jgi:hypothetical protein